MQENEQFLDELEGTIKELQRWYYFWFATYVLFAILTISLPALAATGLCSITHTKLLATGGALFAALSQALRPHEYATAYDAGVQLAWKTQLKLVGGAIDKLAASKEVSRAIDLTTFRYGLVSERKAKET